MYTPECPAGGQRGVTLVETIVFIVLLGIGIAGAMSAIRMAMRGSVDPLAHKQALAIAEALLEEVQAQPFTYCDPDDINAPVAQGAVIDATSGCAALVESAGAEPGEARAGVLPYDNVNDYQSVTLAGITNLSGVPVSGLEAYNAAITVAAQALGTVAANDVNGKPQSLLLTVRVTGPGGADVTLHGYRTRYAPNLIP